MFKETWNTFFNEIPMLGWKLRASKPELWFRIHSLPESKRYPENEDEENIILSRHNEIATEVLGEKVDLLLYWHWIESFHGIEGTKTMDYEDEDIETSLYSAKVGSWQSGKFNKLILAVANDELSQVVFLNPQNGSVYAPYDGGADIYIFDHALKNRLKGKYSKWASERADGL